MKVVAAPAHSAEVIQIFHCQQGENATEKSVNLIATGSETVRKDEP